MQLYMRIGDLIITAQETHANQDNPDEHLITTYDIWDGAKGATKVNGEMRVIKLLEDFHRADEPGPNEWRALFPEASP